MAISCNPSYWEARTEGWIVVDRPPEYPTDESRGCSTADYPKQFSKRLSGVQRTKKGPQQIPVSLEGCEFETSPGVLQPTKPDPILNIVLHCKMKKKFNKIFF